MNTLLAAEPFHKLESCVERVMWAEQTMMWSMLGAGLFALIAYWAIRAINQRYYNKKKIMDSATRGSRSTSGRGPGRPRGSGGVRSIARRRPQRERVVVIDE
jgi:hypothetical protein